MRLRNRFLRYLLPLAGLGAYAMVILSGLSLYMHGRVYPALIAACGMAAVGVYGFNYATDEEDRFSKPGRYVYFRDGIFSKTGWAVLMLASVLLVFLVHGPVLVYATIVAIGFLYSCKLVPAYSREKKLHFIRLKDVMLVKNLVVSSIWSVGGVAILCALGCELRIDPADLIVVVTAVFLSSMANTLASDLSDAVADKRQRVTTFAGLVGRRGTQITVVTLLVAGSVAVGAGWMTGRVSPAAVAFFLLILSYCLVATAPLLFGIPRMRGTVAQAIADSESLACGVGLIALSLVV